MSGTFVDGRAGREGGPAVLAVLARFLSSVAFPLVALSLLAAFELWLVLMLLAPAADSGLGAFANEFRIWCFGYDPATGKLNLSYTVMLFAEPAVLGLIVATIWGGPLRRSLRRLRYRAVALLVAAFGLVALVSLTLLPVQAAPAGELPFPAEELRTSFSPPEIDLVSDQGDSVSLESLRGQVVLVTGIYASCGHTCPILMGQAKRALAALTPSERASVRVLAITLDPESDTREVLAAARERYEVGLPEFQFLGGEPERVNRTLDALQIARRRDPHSGVIDHSNLFIVVDRQGKVAYRLTIGDRQERWLISALRLLTREPASGGA